MASLKLLVRFLAGGTGLRSPPEKAVCMTLSGILYNAGLVVRSCRMQNKSMRALVGRPDYLGLLALRSFGFRYLAFSKN